MLSSITIKNFKANPGHDINLSNLTRVNYLVGKNGSGKSLLLEGVKDKENIDIKKFNLSDYILKNGQATKELSDLLRFNLSEGNDIVVNAEKDILANLMITQNIRAHSENSCQVIDKAVNPPFRSYSGTKEISFDNPAYESYSTKLFDSAKHFIHYTDPVISDTKPNSYFDMLTKEGTQTLANLKFKLVKFLTDELFVDKEFNFYDITRDLNSVHQFMYFDKKQDPKSMPLKALSTGQQSLLNYYFYFNTIIENFKQNNGGNFSSLVLTIDEPETNFHPDFQKKLVSIFHRLVLENKSIQLQFFIATHSPFIISEASKYPETQKVYLIEGGQTVNLDGELGERQEGYSGYEAKEQANKLLGAGLDDFMDQIIICEGSQDNNQSCEFDAKIFNIIFNNKGKLFVSAGGGDIPKNTHIAKKVASKIFQGLVNLVIKDSDLLPEINRNKQIENYKKESLTLKYLDKQCIEAYLLNINYVKKYFEVNKVEVSGEFDAKYNYSEIETSKNTHHQISNRLVKLIRNELHSGCNISKKDNNIYFELAELNKNELYDELHNSIFSS